MSKKKGKELYSSKEQLGELLSAILHASTKVLSPLKKVDALFLIGNKGLWKDDFKNELSKIFKKYSLNGVSLHALLVKNSSIDSSLSHLEEKQAAFLIKNPAIQKSRCSFCKNPTIHDSGLCQGHAEYALSSQK